MSLSTPSGRDVYPDLVFLAASGHVVVVEVKLADNPELRDRAVIAQILDYASGFAALSDEAMLGLFLGPSAAATWADRVRELFPEDDRPEELAEVLRDRIRSGELNLVIACDGIPPGLPEVVRGVAAQKAFGFELDLVEVVPYVQAGSEPGPIFFVPSTRLATEVVARTAVTVVYEQGDAKPEVRVQTTSLEEIERNVEQARRNLDEAKVWTPDEVEEAFGREGTPAERDLLRFLKAHSDSGGFVSDGVKARATVGFYVRGRKENGQAARLMLFFHMLADETVWFGRGLGLAGPEARQEFVRRLKAIFGDGFNAALKEPHLKMSAVERHMAEFRDAVLWFQEQARIRLRE